MRLELDSIKIKDIQESSATAIKDGVLYLNKKELEEELLKDAKIKSVDINIARPGDKTRIICIQDVMQPRCRENGNNFPGFVDKMQIVGNGRTVSLDGAGVIISNPESTRIEMGVLDMDGPMAGLTPYAKLNIVSLAFYPVEDIKNDANEERIFEDAIKAAGLKACVYLAKAGLEVKADEVEVFESEVGESVDPSLPRVAYCFQTYTPQFDYKGRSDKFFYGAAMTNTFPTIINPNEALDGALVGWNAVKAIETYSMQNNGTIKELYKHHGKDLNFVGVVVYSASTDAENRQRSADMCANLLKNVLHADGAVLTKILGGMPHADIACTGVACEKAGVKTCCPTTPLTATGTLADTILYNDVELDLITITGSPFERTWNIKFKAENIYGGDPHTKIYFSEPIPQWADSEVLNMEQYLMCGVHDHTNSRKIITKEF